MFVFIQLFERENYIELYVASNGKIVTWEDCKNLEEVMQYVKDHNLQYARLQIDNGKNNKKDLAGELKARLLEIRKEE
ncbi:MAG: hypothetical protein QXG00_07945 [Candidatus Woesearchaeota archaeon]